MSNRADLSVPLDTPRTRTSADMNYTNALFPAVFCMFVSGTVLVSPNRYA